MKIKKTLIWILVNSIVFCMMILVVELTFFGIYFFAPYLKIDSVVKAARSYYMEYERRIVQFDPHCTRFDSLLSYRLIENHSCLSDNREFKISIDTNSDGLRDETGIGDDYDLIVLGDSQAFGWGVPLESRFTEIIESDLDVNILNTAIPSYGTAREATLYDVLNLRKHVPIIWLYSDNDFRENLHFKSLNGSWRATMRRVDYQIKSRYWGQVHEPMTYLPYTRRFFPMLVDSLSSSEVEQSEKRIRKNANKEADAFYYAMLNASKDIRNTTVMILQVNGWNREGSAFLSALRRRQQKWSEKLGKKNLHLKFIDVSKSLKAEHFYFYDDHLNSEGHKVLAKLLVPFVRSVVGNDMN